MLCLHLEILNIIAIKYLHLFVAVRSFNDRMKNVRKTWIGINHLIGRNKRRCKPIVALPNVLNEFFSSVGQTLAASVPPANHHFSDYLPAVNSPSSFFFEPWPVTSMELDKSHGLYSCSVRVLKSSSSVLSLRLAHIMNNSVLTGKYPSKLKHAKIIPIFKDGDETDPSNYRPIRLFFRSSIGSLRKLCIID